MCLWVEKAHHQELIQNVRETLSELRDLAPERARDMLFDLPPRIAAAAIIFRDFPKRHGNIIEKAVGIALGTPSRWHLSNRCSVQIPKWTSRRDRQFLHDAAWSNPSLRDQARLQ